MGVKSLWSLLTPVGRPVMLDTMEGKAMAIDSSIWLYQFQATMRDDKGQPLSNAHVLGFLRRISKLLFYGIKPIFVFDGGAPVLKRTTLNERRRKKAGAAASHARVAEKLLAAQLRREAVKHALKGKGKVLEPEVIIDETTVYLEDIDPKFATPSKKTPTKQSPASKPKFRDHDPYRLPDVDLEARVAKASAGVAPDPRLATEEELRAFIEDMRPEDFDVTSEAFRELPTEVQYEIVGDLRLKSRQTSYTRLQQMLKSAPTPLDFSKQQIKNLKQRNTLTQQLLTTTDMIGKAHISIPVRIASERNKEYVLLKNEGPAGGWILGIRDDGTHEKPIIIDHDEPEEAIEEDEDMDDMDDMEEVEIPVPAAIDPDLRRYQREMALNAVSRRYTPKGLAPLTTKATAGPSMPLFNLDDQDDSEARRIDEEDDENLAYAIDQSQDDTQLAFAIQQSLDDVNVRPQYSNTTIHDTSLPVTPSGLESELPAEEVSLSFALQESLDDAAERTPHDLPATNSRLAAQLSMANTPPARANAASSDMATVTTFGTPRLLLGARNTAPHTPRPNKPVVVAISTPSMKASVPSPITRRIPTPPPIEPVDVLAALIPDSDDDEMEDVVPTVTARPEYASASEEGPTSEVEDDPQDEQPFASSSKVTLDDIDTLIPWSRSPSPEAPGKSIARALTPPPVRHEDWDAAQEMDIEAEEGDFAQFMSQVKGKDLDVVRREIDDEITSLNQQKRAAQRDSEDINQQMVAQIMTMLRLFGIPYITAPMEAEAQCAELVSLGLADGIITDDSDVFLFGGQQVFKNMFNQSKTVECFLLSDLARELGLDRDTLVRLAYLLGSDYVDGLPGVGPVVAMELIKEFPGEDGLHKFKDWWLKVQSGRDKDGDNTSSFRKRFKKKFKNLHLDNDWPNAVVRDAYYHPVVDDSDEPFKWGLPDLDGLREFLLLELRWSKQKVDEMLLPIIQKMGKRRQNTTANKQGNLTDYISGGIHAPRRRQAFKSKRLQQVVSDFRKNRQKESSNPPSESESGDDSVEEPVVKKRKTAAPARKAAAEGSNKKGRGGAKRATGRARGTAKVKSVDDDGSSFEGEVQASPAPTPTLRPRPKPRPIPRPDIAEGSTADSEMQDVQPS